MTGSSGFYGLICGEPPQKYWDEEDLEERKSFSNTTFLGTTCMIETEISSTRLPGCLPISRDEPLT